MKRRIFLQNLLLATSAPLSLSLGLLLPARALASWPTEAFFATTLDDAFSKLFGGNTPTPNDAIEIQAKEIAEDGSSVPVTIVSHIPGTRSITLLSEKDPNPAVARFNLTSRVEASVRTRIKMGGTGDLVAVVEADGRFYIARKKVKVTAGGCG